jgi:TPR repeat protein
MEMLRFGFVLSLIISIVAPVAHADDMASTLALANKGNAEAQAIMGARYAFGCGVEPSHEQSAKWYMKAAQQGDPWAQSVVGWYYYEGDGLPKNYTQSVMWFLMADKVQPPVSDDLYDLATMFESGQGVPQDNVEAYYWFSRAALIPNDNVADDAVIDRDRMAKQLTKAQRSAVDKRLKKFKHQTAWRPKAGSAADVEKWAKCGEMEHPNRPAWNAYVIKVPSPPTKQ